MRLQGKCAFIRFGVTLACTLSMFAKAVRYARVVFVRLFIAHTYTPNVAVWMCWQAFEQSLNGKGYFWLKWAAYEHLRVYLLSFNNRVAIVDRIKRGIAYNRLMISRKGHVGNCWEFRTLHVNSNVDSYFIFQKHFFKC